MLSGVSLVTLAANSALISKVLTGSVSSICVHWVVVPSVHHFCSLVGHVNVLHRRCLYFAEGFVFVERDKHELRRKHPRLRVVVDVLDLVPAKVLFAVLVAGRHAQVYYQKYQHASHCNNHDVPLWDGWSIASCGEEEEHHKSCQRGRNVPVMKLPALVSSLPTRAAMSVVRSDESIMPTPKRREYNAYGPKR